MRYARDDTQDDHDAHREAEDAPPGIHPSDHLVDGPPAEGQRPSPCQQRVGRGALRGELACEHGGHPEQDREVGEVDDEDLAGPTITEEPVEERTQSASTGAHAGITRFLGSAFIHGSRRRLSHVAESGVFGTG